MLSFKKDYKKRIKLMLEDEYLRKKNITKFFYIGEEDFVSVPSGVKHIEFLKTQSPDHSFSMLLRKPVNLLDYESLKILVKLEVHDYGIYITLKNNKFYCGTESDIDIDKMVDFICELI